MDEHLMTVDELAEFLNVPKSWIYSRTRETGPNAMPKIKVGIYCRFKIQDVLAWLNGRQETDGA